jgi:hypothetical protein
MGRSITRFAKSAPALAVAVLLLVGGGAYALAASGGGTITVCVKHKGGALYKAKKCAKHDSKLSWGKQGPKGATGVAGATGAAGTTGAQGPGGSILSYDANASATPTPTTLGTALGDTISAECALSGGDAETTLFLETPDGSWDADLQSSRYETSTMTGTVFDNHANAFAGTFSAPQPLVQEAASTSTDEVDDQVAITQLGPSPGSMVWHVTAADTTSPAAQTCHVSVLSFPTTLAPVSGSAAAHGPSSKLTPDLLTGKP